MALTFRPGGAGAFQDAAPAVSPDGIASVTLRVAVWGAGGPAAGRFTGMQLQYRREGESSWSSVEPVAPPHSVTGSDGQQLLYRFAFPVEKAFARADYRFVYAIDGQPQTVPGRYAVASPSR